MGLESGNDEGLKVLHKQITVEQNVEAVRILKQIGLMFEFGFMMFDPSSTVASIRDNLQFLKTIIGDGCAAAMFCRMLPYDGTPIKEDLERSGRLRGNVIAPDYDFVDPKVTELYRSFSKVVDVWGWVHGFRSLSPQLNWAWNEIAVMRHLFPSLAGLDGYIESIRGLTRRSNDVLFAVMEDLLDVAVKGSFSSWTTAEFHAERERFFDELLAARNGFVSRHQRVLMEAIDADLALTGAIT